MHKEHDAKARALLESLIAGEQSGDPRPFDFEAFKARKRAEKDAKSNRGRAN
jgi:antitoxin ParD1/3/4